MNMLLQEIYTCEEELAVLSTEVVVLCLSCSESG